MSVTQEIRVPNLGGSSNVEIMEIFVHPGDSLALEAPLLSLETDKAVMEIPSPAAGVLESLAVKVGDKISEGDLIGYMKLEAAAAGPAPVTMAESPAPVAAPAPTTSAIPPAASVPVAAAMPAPAPTQSGASAVTGPAAVPAPAPAKAAPGGRFHATPSVRHFARELGADLSQVPGTGPKGRITKEDVQVWIKNTLSQVTGTTAGSGSAARLSTGLPPVDPEVFRSQGPVEELELNKIRRLTGSRLQANWQTIPMVTHYEEADITDLEEFRKTLNLQLEKEGIKVTPLVFVIKAVVRALQDFPRFNSSLSDSGDRLYLKRYYHIGFAADTPDGLMVPVIPHADRKGLKELARELQETSAKARDKKLEIQKLSGSTFTISSLGGIGGTGFTPLINPPESAILGVSKSQWKPVWNGEAFVPRLILPFSLSYDHRVADGAEAARFCRLIAEILTDFRLSAL